ncbi:unnamed protein product [Effrenium voratum]|uniref:J domain-containing protein n=1 Tax=Effrenium voratum TaxID=2562239 RepID=A0AA36IE55_9DINO|nr:unnamed protein product [Effrenium voratum]
MAPRRGKAAQGQQTLSFWMREKNDEGKRGAPSDVDESEHSPVERSFQDSPRPAKVRKATSAPSLRQRLAARGAEPPPESAQDRKSQSKLFESFGRKSEDDKAVATPCRSPRWATPRSRGCEGGTQASTSSGPKKEDTGSPDQSYESRPIARSGSTISAPEAPEVGAVDAARQSREEAACEEVARILPLRRKRFCSEIMRAKAVLGLGPDAHEVSQVQQAFRSLMRKLHPDRIGVNREATEAMELLREAKASCERAFSRLRAPQAPTRLAATVLCAAVGQRRIRLDWRAPEESRSCPVRRYLVAALDPAYGQALTITVLEPEYNESLKRFTSLDELATYVLAEEELSKLPSFFQQATAVVQVAAENEAGQSAWCTLQLSLRSSASAPRSLKVDEKTTAPRSSKDEKPGKRANPSVPSASSRECREFEATAHSLAREGGNQLCTWLRKQGKALLGTWLRSQGWPTTGSKDELVDRVAFAVGAVGKVR